VEGSKGLSLSSIQRDRQSCEKRCDQKEHCKSQEGTTFEDGEREVVAHVVLTYVMHTRLLLREPCSILGVLSSRHKACDDAKQYTCGGITYVSTISRTE